MTALTFFTLTIPNAIVFAIYLINSFFVGLDIIVNNIYLTEIRSSKIISIDPFN